MRTALLIFFLPLALVAQKLPISLPEELTIDLEAPLFQEGVLTTDEGALIRAKGIRLQARHLRYISKTADGENCSCIEAWGDLSFERGSTIFTGASLEFDFTTNTGTLCEGKGAIGGWYIGGKEIHLCSDGSYSIDNAFITTCENFQCEWALQAKKAHVSSDCYLNAQMVTMRLGKTPIFLLPNFRTDLNSWGESPFENRCQIGKAKGSRLGARYRFFSKNDLTAYLRAEYLINRGPAVGVDTEYAPCNSSTRAHTESYIARDHSIADPSETLRWHCAGHYKGFPLQQSSIQALLTYDWLSDSEMPSDYLFDDFNLHTARHTQLELIQQKPDFILNAFTRVRINTFQTINQELPTLRASLRPKVLGRTGVISSTYASAGYQNFVFARPSKTLGFQSSRLSFNERLYRPFQWGCVSCLPELRGTAIYYSQSPEKREQLLASLEGDFETHLRFFRLFGSFKHVLEPYAHYTYATTPSSLIPNHYVFSREDAYTHLSYLRFGARNFFYKQGPCVDRPLYLDLFTYGFFSTPTIVGAIPRLYSDLTWNIGPNLCTKTQAGWNLAHHQVDHFYSRLALTMSENTAFSCEFRYRGAFDYLKADPFNWVLDSFMPEKDILFFLSDRRYTILLDAFIRLTPTTAIQLETHHGFHRRNGAPYHEGKITLYQTLGCRWYLIFFVEHLVSGNRYGINLKLGPRKCPKPVGHTPTVW